MSYTIKLNDGKYTVYADYSGMYFLRHGELWPAADDLKHCNLVRAMFDRIEELEKGIKAAVDGTLVQGGTRRDDGLATMRTTANTLHLAPGIEHRLRALLDQQ